ncbi:hypothetical protein EYF80_056574 [Liparis tanakae]|uniref:Uncharacterized protein n=1 Tax=Liparis tanakae TaxID=230148 RepID=A0A4Z2EXB8_9TELE|nr:hypothetical protein EYF80_056574 [Liparis tanakae]
MRGAIAREEREGEEGQGGKSIMGEMRRIRRGKRMSAKKTIYTRQKTVPLAPDATSRHTADAHVRILEETLASRSEGVAAARPREKHGT